MLKCACGFCHKHKLHCLSALLLLLLLPREHCAPAGAVVYRPAAEGDASRQGCQP